MSWTILTAGLLLLAPEQANTAGPNVGNVRDCKHGYALVERSLDITKRAMSASDSRLDAMIASNAQFELWDGDAAWTSGEQQGAAAFRAFFKQVDSSKYVVHKGTAPVCGINTKTAVIEFLSMDGKRSVFVTFVFQDLKLLRATGYTDFRENGQLREASNG